MRRVLACLAIAATSLAALPAAAIVGGVEDGDQHPGVGLIYFHQDGTLYRCSGTLVEPTVVVTAAH